MVLFDRATERETLGGLLARAADGFSGTLVLRGEAGLGKTALLDDTVAAAAANGLQMARLTGVESETQLGYAALHRLVLPFRGYLERLPAPQREALRGTFGLVAGPPANRFLVGLGVLTLLADVAAKAPLLCVVDDAQWLDPESAAVLGFVARRLLAERVVFLFAVREPFDESSALSGLPQLAIGGLDDHEAGELLASVAGERLSPQVGAHLIAETGGNPLAIVELARELSPAQLAGTAALPDPLPVGGSLQEVFSPRMSRLPADARLLLAVAAAEPTAPPELLWRAARHLGIDPDAAASADLGDLVEFGPQVTFRHPLARSVAYHAAPPSRRRLIHRALAAVGDGSQDPDRVAWHLGMAAPGPDEAVAASLERAAERARERGGYAAAATFLLRAAELTADPARRLSRRLAAAQAELVAGAPRRAQALLDDTVPAVTDEFQGAQARRLQGEIWFATGRVADAPAVLLRAARAFEPIDRRASLETLLATQEATLYAGPYARETSALKVARAALAALGPPERHRTTADLLLRGFAVRLTSGRAAAAPILRRAIASARSHPDLRWRMLACLAAGELLDDEAWEELAVGWAQTARDQGALTTLPVALNYLSWTQVLMGRFGAAEANMAEAHDIAAWTGFPGVLGVPAPADLLLQAWRGDEEARPAASAFISDCTERGHGAGRSSAQVALAVLELGQGRFEAARNCALDVFSKSLSYLGTLVLPDLVEASVRCGDHETAAAALVPLPERALASGTDYALGLLARSRALLTEGAEAERLYQEGITYLTRCRVKTALARTHLVYGEWLRRQRRRRDARAQLRTAHDMLAAMGADGFAERARIELNATGEHVGQRVAGTADVLTPQEAQIARMVSHGYRNRDIAAQLFVSPATVDYHLRKVFRKLGVASRTQLANTLMTGSC